MTTHEFLSAGWIESARAIRAEYEDRVPSPEVPVRANVTVTDVPFDDGRVDGYIDTSEGTIQLEYGTLPDAELTVTTDYETARALFVSQDLNKIMESFMLGKILVTGDMSRLLSLTPPTAPEQLEMAQEISARLEAITAG